MEDHNNISTCSENGLVIMKMESYLGASKHYDLRTFSASYSQTQITPKDLKKEKSINKSWSFNDAEFQRKKRVATYKMYCIEGKTKGSLKKGFKWLKDKYSQAAYGLWWFTGFPCNYSCFHIYIYTMFSSMLLVFVFCYNSVFFIILFGSF